MSSARFSAGPGQACCARSKVGHPQPRATPTAPSGPMSCLNQNLRKEGASLLRNKSDQGAPYPFLLVLLPCPSQPLMWQIMTQEERGRWDHASPSPFSPSPPIGVPRHRVPGKCAWSERESQTAALVLCSLSAALGRMKYIFLYEPQNINRAISMTLLTR